MDNKNLPAYPHVTYEEGDNSSGMFTPANLGGFTKRELGAFMILQGMRTNPHYNGIKDETLWEWAQQDADGLLIHLENTSK